MRYAMEGEYRRLVEAEIAAYLARLQASGPPYVADEAAWQSHAAAIAAAAVALYYAQGAPPPGPYGPDEAATLATEIASSNLVAGVPAAVDAKIGVALLAGTAAAAAIVESVQAWAVLASIVAGNVFLWAVEAGTLAAAVARGDTHKTWAARLDDKTRPDHRAADGQTVPIGASFTVGGWAMRYPHDPLGPANEVYGCRCKLKFSRRKTWR